MITAMTVLGLLILAAAVYGAYTARADRRYMAWASDETDWRRRRNASESEVDAKRPAKEAVR